MPREAETPHPATSKRTAPVFFGGAWQDAALFDRTTLNPGATFNGPAIVTQADCTVLIPPGWHARLDGLQNIVMEQG